MIESNELLFIIHMNALSEMYPVFESPFPTLLTHTENGLGIFVAHAKVEMAIKNIGVDEDIFRIITDNLNFFFPLKEHARALLKNRGGVLAFTDESGMPWYTLEMPALQPVVPTVQDTAFVRVPTPRAKFGRPAIRPSGVAPVKARPNEEGEFSL